MRVTALYGLILTLFFAHSSIANGASVTTVAVHDDGDEIIVAGPKPEAALVLIGGALVRAEQYVELAQTIAETSGGSVAVFIPHFIGNVALPQSTAGKIQAAIKYLTDQGVDNPQQRVFAAGHSHGGIAVHAEPVTQNLGGLILLASYLPRTLGSNDSILNYPKPVLTVGGELDGLTGINYIARDFLSVADLARRDAQIPHTKPVVIVRGMNHMQFADGEYHDGDSIPVGISLRDAHQAVARVVVDFVAAQNTLSQVSTAAAQAALKLEQEKTASLLQPYERTANQSEDVCATAQRQAVELSAPGWDKIAISPKVYKHGWADAKFILDKSSVKASDNGHTLHLPVLIDEAVNPVDLSKDHSVVPRTLFCKMRTGSMIAKETGMTALRPDRNCAEINQQVIADALKTITDAGQRQRLADKFGDTSTWALEALSTDTYDEVTYGPFQIHSERQKTGQGWIGSRFDFSPVDSSHWQLTTGELHTADDIRFKMFAGAFYCKILPPSRIIEWATLFGLKN